MITLLALVGFVIKKLILTYNIHSYVISTCMYMCTHLRLVHWCDYGALLCC